MIKLAHNTIDKKDYKVLIKFLQKYSYLNQSVITKKSKWEENVPEQIADIIKENWNVVTKFASSEDKTMRIVGMKFPKEGYNSK